MNQLPSNLFTVTGKVDAASAAGSNGMTGNLSTMAARAIAPPAPNRNHLYTYTHTQLAHLLLVFVALIK